MLVAHGDYTPKPEESVYSSVISLHSLRFIAFLSELNQQQHMQCDIGNDYLESYTNKKVFFNTGPEFGPLTGHTLVIVKALYGLCSSGLCFHDKLADTLHMMGFFPTYANHDVWMQDPTDPTSMYDYVVVYVDNLFASMSDPAAFF